jgi:hypothetical protein
MSDLTPQQIASERHRISTARLERAGKALYGSMWQTDLGRDLAHKDGRQVRQWMAGHRSIPNSAWKRILELIESRHAELERVTNALNAELRTTQDDWNNE